MPTLTLKIPAHLKAQIAAAAQRRRMSRSALVREAIERSLREPLAPKPSLFDRIRDLVEALPKPKGPPTDRSTNPRYMEGFGLDNAQYRKKFGRGRRTG